MTGVEASIVVPSRGGAYRLPLLLGALSAQDRQDFEVIVVLDGVIDDSESVIDRFAAKPGLLIRSLVFPENRGRSAALNAGADVARGRVLIRCDDDYEPGKAYVSTHVAAHRHSPVGIVGLARNIFPETSYAKVYGRLADARFRHQAIQARPNLQWRYWGGNVSVLRKIHDRIGGYDENFRTYGWEDVDYGFRLHRSGIPVRIEPSLTTVHHAAATTTTVRALRALHSGAARETFIAKHGIDVLQDPAAVNGVWDVAVGACSLFATEKTLRGAGHLVDLATAVLPQRVSEKLIALAVESAGRAGIKNPKRARSGF